ncbi:MAG: fibronectin type III domain-containing protein, partial [Nocardioides sp.]|nr:fibronectin type III domain-containing protein [Nocardioides sp.]
PLDQTSFAAQAQPDVIRGEVGQPIKIRPLLNDLPGSDPTANNAELTLGGKVPPQAGAKVVSDLDSGEVTFTGDRAGTYFLKYDVAFGNATFDQGTIRVDVKPQPKRASDPIAMPDQLTIYGQAPGVVDVLSNDLDPAGGLLVVQRAVASREDSVDVAIIDGRWLRISSRQPDMVPATQTIAYTISNGTSSAVRGEVVVTQRTAPQDNTPVTVADRVVVRAGTAVSAPVLDNDLSPSGDRLTLLGDLADGRPGQLDIVRPPDVTGDVGQAFVSGRLVRYVAPMKIKERDTYEVTYVAQNLDGERGVGRLFVTVVPVGDPNDPPEPPTLEGRVLSADTVKIRVPGVGVDRNGDPVTVTGITSAPRLGRIVSIGGNFLEYQAYPRTVGTDEFTYSVVDSQGAFATGLVRVAVVPPGQPQPPLAVADRLTVEPGRTATFDPLANDFIAPGDDVRIELVDPADGVRIDPDTDLVTVKASGSLTGPPVVVVYRVTNGLAESRATMTLETAEDFNNPPVVYDAFGRANDSGSVVVDVLDGAYDPDGSADDLTVTDVYGDPDASVVDGAMVRVNRAAAPKVLPFRVEDGDGGAAAATVYVPPTGSGLPFVLPGAQIDLDAGDSVTGEIGDYVGAPSGARVRLASGRRSYSASPTALSVGPLGDNRFELSASAGFSGPGALLVEVTTANDASGNEDSSTTDDGVTVLLSIPVQVGDDTPVLECPSTVIPISAGQEYDLDIANFCTVFTLDPRDAAGLSYEATWSSALDGLDAGAPQGSVIPVSAAEDATRGGEAVLAVRAGESNTEEVRFRLAQAPPPTLLPVRVETMEAGTSRTYDLASYLQAGVPQPEPTIVSVQSQGNSGVRATTSGSELTLTAAQDARGVRASFTIVMSDVSSVDPPPERVAQGRIQFEVVGTPSAPGAPRPFSKSQTETITMSWQPPSDDGGAPILFYNVKEQRTGAGQRCDTNTCVFRKLKNGDSYSFRVQAVNRVGPGEWSPESEQARADTEPGRVENIRLVDRGDGTITVGWDKPRTQTSKVLDYTLTWLGGQTVVSGTSYAVPGLNNNEKYIFAVKARNKVGYSAPRSSVEMQPLGTPPAPAAPAVTDLEAGANQTALRIDWGAVLPEGPGPTVYTVSYTNGTSSGAVPGCQGLASLTCTHTGVPYDGLTYTYTVVAANSPSDSAGNRSAPSAGTSIEAVGRPAPWGAFSAVATGTSQELELQYTVPDSRGTESRVDILVGGVVNRAFGQQAGPITTRIQVPSNEQPYPVQLRVCNERAPAGCTLSGLQNAQTYGPLGDALGTIQPIVNGRSIQWVISGTSNGDPAVVQFQVRNSKGSDAGVQTLRPSGVGAFSFTTPVFMADQFEQEQEIFVTVLDDSPDGRGQDTGSGSVNAGPPPPPTIGISRGARCQDDAADQPACADAVDIAANRKCTVDSCAYAVLTITFAEGISGNWSCDFDKFLPQRSKNGSGNFSGQVDPYYASGERVVGNCNFGGSIGKIVFDTTFP